MVAISVSPCLLAGGTPALLNSLLFESYPMGALFYFAAFLRLHHFFGHPIKLFEDDRLAAHACHERYNQRTLVTLVESGADVGVKYSAAARTAQTHVGFDYAHHFELAEDLAHALGRIGPDRPQANQADLQALGAHVLYGKTRGHGVAALHEKDYVGAIGHELFDPRVVSAAEDFCELIVDLFNDPPRLFPGARPFQLH